MSTGMGGEADFSAPAGSYEMTIKKGSTAVCLNTKDRIQVRTAVLFAAHKVRDPLIDLWV